MSAKTLIYHNPRCSKSRETLALLEERGIDFEKTEYLKTPPDADTIMALSKLLNCPVSDLVRKGEADYKSLTCLPADSDDSSWAKTIARHPALLQRPIVVHGSQAAIGRPPENVLSIF